MVRVLVISNLQHLRRQIIPGRFQNIEFVFDTSANYDYIAVIDSVEKELVCKVPTHKRILYIGEPPYIKPFTSSYLKQYGRIVGPYKVHHPHFKLSYPVLPWFVGNERNLDAAFFQKLERKDYKRLNKFCIITSNKRFTQGHRKRVAFVERVKEEYPDLLDIYGMGYQPVEDKFDVLSKYKYCLAIENCVCPNYWTEKIGDAFLSMCIPFYYGCSNINQYFSKNSFVPFDINFYDQAVAQMQAALSDTPIREASLKESKLRVINQYNLFQEIAKDIRELEVMPVAVDREYQPTPLKPYRYTFTIKVRQRIAWNFNLII